MRFRPLIFAFALLASCSSKNADPPPPAGARASFVLDSDFASESAFWDFPWPSDLRLGPNGGPIGTAFPNPLGKQLVEGIRKIAGDRKGYPVIPTAYFHFDHALVKRDPFQTIAGGTSSPILLVDVDPKSPQRGTFIPTVASTPTNDDYVPEGVLAVAPRPGFVLYGNRTYAFVVLKSLGDASGAKLDADPTFTALMSGQTPSGARGAQAAALYGMLRDTLATKNVAVSDVAIATVFTTGDVVADFAAMTDKLVGLYSPKITALAVDPDDGAKHDRYCELKGTITMPQFQAGKAPFDTEGLFEVGADGVPKKQRDETIPLTVTFPRQPMPKGGYPLVAYFHGSGGLSTAVVDRGRWHVETDPTKCPEGKLEDWNGTKGCNTKGEGPAFVLAPHGIGAAGSALPVNPERVPGAGETAYLNFANLAAFRDTFRQGVIEQRLFIAALKSLTVDPSVVAACTGMSLPDGETAYHYREDPLLAQGQSMGGMYTNLIGATEPRIKAVTPTGAGGYWSLFITKTNLYSDGGGLVAALVGAAPDMNFLHPVLTAFETAVEVSDPFVYMPRVARRPLPGHPVRSIYEPVGKGDSYFPTVLYDAISLSYGHKEAGDVIWPTMQDALKLASLDGVIGYPVVNDLKSETGTPYTGVVVQYNGDGIYDPHALYTQLDQVQYQYGCFFETFVAKGIATVPAPAPLGTPCPGL